MIAAAKMQITKWQAQRQVRWEASATSAEIDISGFAPLFLHLPDGFAGTAITFEQRIGDAWVEVYAEGEALTHTAHAGTVERLPAALSGLSTIRLVSDASETASGTLLLSS